jgi:protein TonB
LRASSLTASFVLHGALITGAVLAGVFAVNKSAPRRVYELRFDDSEAGVVLPDEAPEELASLEREVPVEPDLEPELLPEAVHPRVDPDLFREPAPADVEGLAPVPVSSEMVFGFVEEADEEPVVESPEATAKIAADEMSDELEPEPVVLVRTEGQDPSYPGLSLKKREEGDVVLRLAIDTEGRVTLVELAESSGFRRLDQAAMSAAPTWRFEVPPDGPPDSFEHTVHFRLERR